MALIAALGTELIRLENILVKIAIYCSQMALIAALGTELIPITRHPSQPSVCTEMVSLLILLKLVLPHASHHSENLRSTVTVVS